MKLFKLNDCLRCLKAGDNNEDLYFIIENIDCRFGYSIKWLDCNLGGAINFDDVSMENGKIFIFKEHEVEFLSEHETLAMQIKYA